MIHTIKKAITIFSLVIFGSALLYNCEPDADTLGEQLFLDGAAQGKDEAFDVIAYNINNHDSIRSDAAKLRFATLGAFSEGQFGMQKASYLTQLRLSTYNPDFGENAVVDSVVLVMKPTYASDSVKTTTVDDNYTYKTTADETVNAKKVVNTYPVLKFGKAKRTFTINVNEVTEFLKSPSDTVKSNQTFDFDNANVLGTKEFKGDISSVAITKDGDGSALFTASTPGIRIQLNKTFFQDKIIAKKGQPELQDASNFIRHIKGLRISVVEQDGYLFQFSPNDMELIMYYKNGTGTTKTPATYTFALGAANTHIGQYQYDRTNSAVKSVGYNSTLGDPKLYAQGMGGPSIGIRIDPTEINKIKNLIDIKKAAIISAKIRIYTDPLWNNKNYLKPTEFTLLRKYVDPSDSNNPTKVKTGFTNDLLKLAGVPGYTILKAYDLDQNPAQYDFVVTQSIKEMVEANSKPDNDKTETKYFKIDIGRFEPNDTQTSLKGYKFTSTPYDTKRVVFTGTEAGNPKRVQLIVTYGTK
jgi:hypothetical protein